VKRFFGSLVLPLAVLTFAVLIVATGALEPPVFGADLKRGRP
jgi:hypothetical protein